MKLCGIVEEIIESLHTTDIVCVKALGHLIEGGRLQNTFGHLTLH